MSDEQFRRPGEPALPTSGSWPYESPGPEGLPSGGASRSAPADHADVESGSPTGQPRGAARFRSVAAIAVVALLVGGSIGVLATHRPPPAPISITVDSFPRELLGLKREDAALRQGGYKPVTDRLDTHFQAQLDGYRFAYGGEGAQFRYGDFTTLTIVNGQLAPDVPVADDTEWATPIVKSLNTRDTSCVSWEASSSSLFVVIDAKTGVPLDPMLTYDRKAEKEEKRVWTDCVLFDRTRNLALRLDGHGPNRDILEAAGQFRDELKRIHDELID